MRFKAATDARYILEQAGYHVEVASFCPDRDGWCVCFDGNTCRTMTEIDRALSGSLRTVDANSDTDFIRSISSGT